MDSCPEPVPVWLLSTLTRGLIGSCPDAVCLRNANAQCKDESLRPNTFIGANYRDELAGHRLRDLRRRLPARPCLPGLRFSGCRRVSRQALRFCQFLLLAE